MIGVLREGDGATSEPPQPTLADLPALVEESRAAGMRVELRGRRPRARAAATRPHAYRIVQEGLTNARKHAPGARSRSTVDGRAATGSRSRSSAAAPSASRRGGRPPPGAGSGLIGLAERVALAGGELEHGRRRAATSSCARRCRGGRASASCSSTTTRSCAPGCG